MSFRITSNVNGSEGAYTGPDKDGSLFALRGWLLVSEECLVS